MTETLANLAITLSLAEKIAIAALWLGLVGLTAWLVYQRPQVNPEITRKIVHIGTGNVVLIAWALAIPAWVGITSSLVFSGVALASYALPLLPGINSVGRKSWGTFFYAISIGILVAWFWPLGLPQFAALGILIMTWGDGLAGLIGKAFGRNRYKVWGMEKSWEGTLTMVGVSGVVTLAVLGMAGGTWQGTLAIALIVGLAAGGLEAFSWLGIDNLTVPLGVAGLGFFLSRVLY